mmetsp:Transcript_3715/g.11559  ORF Transcript_3715/g.11559 Transcript_3715/m.11559 type:complete len:217 (-) Transcript_3715:36-686(-)
MSASTTFSYPAPAACISAVLPEANSHCRSISAPCHNANSISFSKPYVAATTSTVAPLLICSETSAPRWSSASASPSWPFIIAIISSVMPLAGPTLALPKRRTRTSRSLARRRRATSAPPHRLAEPLAQPPLAPPRCSAQPPRLPRLSKLQKPQHWRPPPPRLRVRRSPLRRPPLRRPPRPPPPRPSPLPPRGARSAAVCREGRARARGTAFEVMYL